jgi:ABC-type multidrug transport system fused ATPase/permease subunit
MVLKLLAQLVVLTSSSVILCPVESFAPTSPALSLMHSTSSASMSSPLVVLSGKKNKRKGGGGGGGYSGGGGQQPKQEKQSVQDQRFDAATRQFMFTLTGLSKTLPDKSKKILDNIHLSFYPGAKIGIVGLNGSG